MTAGSRVRAHAPTDSVPISAHISSVPISRVGANISSRRVKPVAPALHGGSHWCHAGGHWFGAAGLRVDLDAPMSYPVPHLARFCTRRRVLAARRRRLVIGTAFAHRHAVGFGQPPPPAEFSPTGDSMGAWGSDGWGSDGWGSDG